MMKQRDWKIIYSGNYTGITKRTINLLSKEVGRFLIREEMVYSIYILPCEKEGCEVSKSAIFVGLYDESETIRKYVKPEELVEGGFTVKVIRNPEDEEGSFVFLTAKSELELFYSAVSFLDEYIPTNAPASGCNRMVDQTFDIPLPESTYSEKPDHKIRSIFTWGHSINSYRDYIDNMARAKFNELIIWNDYIPINIDEIIEYAHSYGISVVLGYSWGWREIGNKATEISEETIKNLEKLIVDTYRDKYHVVGCDGIYFQTFTERKEERVGGKLISEMVTEMVNNVAAELWKIKPDLRLIFGLHASSVRNRLAEISNVDPRIEILWEDCGSYPFDYAPFVKSEEEYEETLKFVKEMLELRGGKGVGLAFKGVMMLDWSKKVGQHGPYVMGENAPEIADHDRRLRNKAWKKYSADWMCYGDYVHRMMQYINENELSDTTMCIAGTFDGGLYLPFALCGQMFRDNSGDYTSILRKVVRQLRTIID